MTTSRGAIYARKSNTDKRNPGKSVADQVREAQKVAGWLGIEVQPDHIFEEDGISASRFARHKRRPEFDNLLDTIARGEVDVLLMAELSRSTRRLSVLGVLLETCQDAGVKLVIDGKELDPSDPGDLQMIGIQGSVDAAESQRTQKRTTRGIRGSAEAGRPHGKDVYGYRRVYDPNVAGRLLHIEVVPEEADVIARCAREVLAGASMYEVANRLNADGVPSPYDAVAMRRGREPKGAKWAQTQVRRVITSPTYTGVRTHNGQVAAEAIWPAIISRRDHERLLGVVNRHKQHGSRNERPGAVKHLLGGIATCGVCGKGVVRTVGSKWNRPTYMCRDGFHVSRVAEPVDDLVTATVLALVSRPGFLAAVAESEDDGGEAASIIEEAEALTARQAEVRDLIVTGALPAADGAALLTDIASALEATESRLRAVVMPRSVSDLVPSDLPERWDDLSVTQKREIIRALVTVQIMPKGKTRFFDPESVRITPKGAKQ